jgi:hypothetical protein
MTVDLRLIGCIDRLTESVNVCYEADGSESAVDYKKSYPYATGFSRSAMKSVISELKSIVSEMRDSP